MVVDLDEPLDYIASRSVLEALLVKRVMPRLAPEDRATLAKVTWHSCKVTMLDAASSAGESDRVLTLQGHWAAGSSMPLKYSRKRLVGPLAMIGRVVAARTEQMSSAPASSAWQPATPRGPGGAPASSKARPAVGTPPLGPTAGAVSPVPLFVVSARPGAKYHWMGSNNRTACDRFPAVHLLPIGAFWPTRGDCCGSCSRVSPLARYSGE